MYVLTLFIAEKSRSQFTDDTGVIRAMLARRLRHGEEICPLIILT